MIFFEKVFNTDKQGADMWLWAVVTLCDNYP